MIKSEGDKIVLSPRNPQGMGDGEGQEENKLRCYGVSAAGSQCEYE
jgi:hypothetical protein